MIQNKETNYDARSNIKKIRASFNEIIIYINGIRKEVWDADKYPYLMNKEKIRRLEEQDQITIEKYIAYREFMHFLRDQFLRDQNERFDMEKTTKDKVDSLVINQEMLKKLLSLPTDDEMLSNEMKWRKLADEKFKEFSIMQKNVVELINKEIGQYKIAIQKVEVFIRIKEESAASIYKDIYSNIPNKINTVAYDAENRYSSQKDTKSFQYDERALFVKAGERIYDEITKGNISCLEENKLKQIGESAVRDELKELAKFYIQENLSGLNEDEKQKCEQDIVNKSFEIIYPKFQEKNQEIHIALRQIRLEIIGAQATLEALNSTVCVLETEKEKCINLASLINENSTDSESKCEAINEAIEQLGELKKMAEEADDLLFKSLPIPTIELPTSKENNQKDNNADPGSDMRPKLGK